MHSYCAEKNTILNVKNKQTNRTKPRSELTNMNDVPVFVQHDVAVVPVFNLQQEQQEAVGSHAADEVVTSLQG